MSGLVQVVQLPPSMRHSNVEPASVELKVNFGVVLSTGRPGRVDGRVRRGQVDGPGVARRGAVGVADGVGCADLEGVAAGGERRRAVSGLEQVVQLPPSMRHSKVEPGSVELKVKVGVVLFDGSAGAESIVVLGAVRSIVQVKLAGVPSVLPAGSVARTSKVCVASAEDRRIVCGLEHDVQLPPSMRHSKLEPASFELKANVGVVSLDGLGGVESIVVCGAVVSIVHVWLAGLASVFPAASVARTSKVWLPWPRAGVV